MQGHHSAKPHTSCQVPRCHVHACCSRSCELVDAQALSTHRSRVLVRRQFSLPAYTQVINFCNIFGRGNGGRLIRGTAYTRVYTVCKQLQAAVRLYLHFCCLWKAHLLHGNYTLAVYHIGQMHFVLCKRRISIRWKVRNVTWQYSAADDNIEILNS